MAGSETEAVGLATGALSLAAQAVGLAVAAVAEVGEAQCKAGQRNHPGKYRRQGRSDCGLRIVLAEEAGVGGPRAQDPEAAAGKS